jgi:hypothetical protein
MPPSNYPGAPFHPGHQPDPVIINLKPSTFLIILTSVIMVPLGLIFVFGALFAENTPEARVFGIIFGALFLLIWAWVFSRFVRTRSAFVAIGPMGINRHINSDQWIRWDEISAVGISVLYTHAPRTPNAGQALARAILPSAGTNITVRLRIAGIVPGLPSRPDLSQWLTRDEPAPYTHKVLLPRSMNETLERLGSVELAHAGLSRYAGSLYTGVDYRETAVGRYT